MLTGIGAAARDRGAGGVPPVFRRRGPGKVVHRVGGELPHQPVAAAGSPCPGPARPGPRSIRWLSLSSTRDRRSRAVGGEHLVGILQRAGGADQVARRHVEVHLEAAVVVVELAGAEVRLAVPAAQVVVLGTPADTTAPAGTPGGPGARRAPRRGRSGCPGCRRPTRSRPCRCHAPGSGWRGASHHDRAGGPLRRPAASVSISSPSATDLVERHAAGHRRRHPAPRAHGVEPVLVEPEHHAA